MKFDLNPIQHGRWVSSHLGGRVVLASGDLLFDRPERVLAPLGDGLRIIVVLTGQMSVQVGSSPAIRVGSPTVCAFLTVGEHSREQVFEPDVPYRFALVHIDPDIVRSELGIDPFALLDEEPAFKDAEHVILASRPAEPAIQSVANQVLACPRDPAHNLYLLGKAMELAAIALEGFRKPEGPGRHRRLSLSEIDRIRNARDILIESMTEPPQLAEIANRVGLNIGKLNRGFRSSYGATPYAYLQEYRLQTAYRMLSSGDAGVGEVAYAVGYSPAHFATLFRKRFGISPSELTAK